MEADPVVAARYSRMAAEQGDGDMTMDIGDRFLDGNGVKRDVDKASHYYKLAQGMGLSSADDKLGSMVPTHAPLQPPWDTYMYQ
eukprot:SAG22_NODE_688_length_7907_cov_7.557505_5_plen_84_part_00